MVDGKREGGIKQKWFNEFPKDLEINVPFSYHTKLSGIERIEEHNVVWYHKDVKYDDNLENVLLEKGITITDDAMVVESMCGGSVKLVEGSYENIKVTTPEDMIVAESFLKRRTQ